MGRSFPRTADGMEGQTEEVRYLNSYRTARSRFPCQPHMSPSAPPFPACSSQVLHSYAGVLLHVCTPLILHPASTQGLVVPCGVVMTPPPALLLGRPVAASTRRRERRRGLGPPPETTHITLRYSSTYVWQERGKDGGSGLGMPYSVHMPGTQVSPRETFMAQPTALHPPWILPPSPLFPIPQFPLDQTKAVSTIGTPSFPLPLVNAHHAHAWPIRLQTPPLPNNLACFIPIACALPPNASLVSLF